MIYLDKTLFRAYDKSPTILFYTLPDRTSDEKILTFSIIFFDRIYRIYRFFLSATKFCQRQKIL